MIFKHPGGWGAITPLNTPLTQAFHRNRLLYENSIKPPKPCVEYENLRIWNLFMSQFLNCFRSLSLAGKVGNINGPCIWGLVFYTSSYCYELLKELYLCLDLCFINLISYSDLLIFLFPIIKFSLLVRN